jgi:hypothetical protein
MGGAPRHCMRRRGVRRAASEGVRPFSTRYQELPRGGQQFVSRIAWEEREGEVGDVVVLGERLGEACGRFRRDSTNYRALQCNS